MDTCNFQTAEIILFLGKMCSAGDIIDGDDCENEELEKFFVNYVMPQAQKHGFAFKYDCKKSFSSFVKKNADAIGKAAKALVLDSMNEILVSKRQFDESDQSLETHPISWYSNLIVALSEHLSCDFDDNEMSLYIRTINYLCQCLSEEFKKVQHYITTQTPSRVQLIWHLALCELNEQAIVYVIGAWQFVIFMTQLKKSADSISETEMDTMSEHDTTLLMEAMSVLEESDDVCCLDCDEEDDDYDDEDDDNSDDEEASCHQSCCKRR